MTTDKNLEKGISDIVGAFTDLILVFLGGWGDTLPEWLKGAITMERLIENIRTLKEGEMTGTNAEACAYLYMASLTTPMDSDWTQIYLYLATKVYKKWRTRESGVDIPEDIRVDELDDYRLGELHRLKEWIYRQRSRARQERDRAERHRLKEEETAREKTEQPALFDF